MRTQLIHGSGRVWRAASLAASGAAVVLTIGAVGAAPAQASGGGVSWGGGDEGPLVGGVAARPWPPGRGVLVSGRTRPQLVQCCRIEDQPTLAADAWFQADVAAGTSR